MLQFSDLIASPTQDFPPFWAKIRVVLLFSRCPLPHVLEQEDHALQEYHWQSTTEMIYDLIYLQYYYIGINFYICFDHNCNESSYTHVPGFGHDLVLQFSDLIVSPTQGLPPFLDLILSLRCQIWVPPSHDLEHSLYLDQLDHWQSTETITWFILTLLSNL